MGIVRASHYSCNNALERRDEDRDNEPEWKAHQTAERVIQESGVPVRHERGDRAYYNLQTDRVTLPEREQFATANGYYQTVARTRARHRPPRADGPRHAQERRREFRQHRVRPRRTPRRNVGDDDRRAGRRSDTTAAVARRTSKAG